MALREHLLRLAWHRHESPLPAATPPRFAADELLGVMPVDGRKQIEAARAEKDAAEERWLALEMEREALENQD